MKQYKVKIWIAYSPSEVIIMAMNSANALSIAKKLYPNARVISAKSTLYKDKVRFFYVSPFSPIEIFGSFAL